MNSYTTKSANAMTESKLIVCNDTHPRSEEEKTLMIKEAAYHYGEFMTALGFDWKNDPNAMDTPRRVAKSFVNDLAEGCYNEAPKITAFPNDGYSGVVFLGNITCHSLCAHHHLSFLGVAHVAYIPSTNGKMIGLSKLNRMVEYFARRPQIQENLTTQIHNFINQTCEQNLGVAVMIEANHLCACVRGIKHNSTMKTAKLSGAFMDQKEHARQEFYDFVRDLKKGNV